ncbi:MAG: transcriptional regulator NrdR [Candidatus Marinimicrobia bacterium]|nr:transcriptional regulator NrdR [Candidatus Neomarinimicrobiota bacterium]MBV67269.1 transcriptional regulator NrdR [Candidatus Neomarinimicrobiota bacterium]|tara:strand:- start:6344 stop:6790 length:447 start_codon:yes stop_codon:yes gene_type:complete
MKCSKCDSMRTRVIDSRVTEKGYTIRRRRVCESCSFRFTTYEYVFAKKIIIKKNGVRQEYDRIKLENSIRISCTKRPISEKVIQESMMKIEEMVNNFNNVEISSRQIGEFVMNELKNIDKVAFIRFASVYREFEDLGEFKSQIDDLSN